MKRVLSFLLLLLCTGLPALLLAQTDSTQAENPELDAMMRILTSDPLILDPPSEDFVPMEVDKGYEYPALKAKLAYLMMPIPYEQMKADMEQSEEDARPGVTLLEKGETRLGNHTGLFLKSRMTPPPKDKEAFGDFIMVMFVIPLTDGQSCASMYAVYPESHQEELAPLIFKAMGEARAREE